MSKTGSELQESHIIYNQNKMFSNTKRFWGIFLASLAENGLARETVCLYWWETENY